MIKQATRRLFILLLMISGTSEWAWAQRVSSLRPVATYSIVARDSVTGEMGVAVQSHWFSVGSIVAWAEAGVGAVATQFLYRPRLWTARTNAHEVGERCTNSTSRLARSGFRQGRTTSCHGRCLWQCSCPHR